MWLNICNTRACHLFITIPIYTIHAIPFTSAPQKKEGFEFTSFPNLLPLWSSFLTMKCKLTYPIFLVIRCLIPVHLTCNQFFSLESQLKTAER